MMATSSIRNFARFFPLTVVGAGLLLASPSAHAYDQILHEYQDVRTSGMGGVFETTGLYDQNFFGNPARVCANPTWRVTVLDPTLEVDSSAISHVSAVTSSGNTVQKVAETAGSNNHLRLETTMPGYFLPVSMSRKWAIGVALITSEQIDFGLRNNYDINSQALIFVGPAVTFGHTFLDDDSLAVGITGHFMYGISTTSPYTIVDLLQGNNFTINNAAGQGTNIDFDLGVTKRISNWHPLGLNLDLGFAVDNVMGGKFDKTTVNPLSTTLEGPDMYRRFGGGISISRPSMFFLKDTTLALEASDIGPANRDGSFYRTLHLGGETRLVGVLLGRLGVNQGYFTAGAGIDLKVLTIDAATYGEELGLNAGDMEDRIYAVRVALQI